MTALNHIVPATGQDTDTLGVLIAAAFHDLAPSRWLVPEPDARRDILPAYFALLVADTLERGRVYTTTDRTAAALWLHAGPTPAPVPDGWDHALAAVTGPYADRFRLFDAELARRHPAGIIHDHLAILAVHPDHQRRGQGTDLLHAHHGHIDGNPGTAAAYLEASDAGTREYYRRHGYTDHGDPIRLPLGPAMYPMLRAAAPPS